MADIGTYVSHDARGTGVGSALIDATVRGAHERGITALRAVIRRANLGAVGYYRSIGFVAEVEAPSACSVARIFPLPN